MIDLSHSDRPRASLLSTLTVAALLIFATGCEDSTVVDSSTKQPLTTEATSDVKGAHGSSAANGATVLRARLEPVGSSGVTGEVMVRMKGDDLKVSVNAKGLEASVEHAQHFHANASCENFGPPVISLDDDIANNPRDATNADPGDDVFPTATPGGTVNYRGSVSKSEVMAALGEALDLENRTAIVHAAGSPIGPPAACGALNPVGQ